MTTLASAAIDPVPPQLPLAPWWHTALLLGLFAALTVGGALFQHHASVHPGSVQQHPNMLPTYLSLLCMEWGLFLFVSRGLRRNGYSVGELIGGRWPRPRELARDVALALALWGLWSLVDLLWTRWSGPDSAASIQSLLPRGPVEVLLWIALSISAGICEELTFRGYLQRQFASLLHNRALAVLLQALVFGIAHGYQGIEACARIAAYGVLFGLLAWWRGSLRPGMVAHAWTDIASGLFGI
jgi:uncharacterized protein